MSWESSVEAWIVEQGEHGDESRREILDPVVDSILSSVDGLKILDVGCGEGRYARKLKSRGAIVTGIDSSPLFIEACKKLDVNGDYVLGPAERLPFVDESFDVVLSYLTLMDIDDDLAAIDQMCRVARRGGEVVIVAISNMASCTTGWVKDSSGRKLYRTVDRYMECFPMDCAWRGIEIVNWHRPLSRTLTAFLDNGMSLTRFQEPLPSRDSRLYESESRVPTFQVYTLVKL
ncbi:MAG: class I SAM-dependent methyltransferase [Chthonomonadaceae bacterium]|nr:class I SAM-dependent methyltransferase [Chthonomonadaceae bacterium]